MSEGVRKQIEERRGKSCKGMKLIPLKKECLYAFTNVRKESDEATMVERKIRDQYSAFTNVECYSTTEVCRRENKKKPTWFVIYLPLSNRLLTVRVVPMTEDHLAFAFRVHNWSKNDMGSFGMIHWGSHKGIQENSSLKNKVSGLELKGKEKFLHLHVHKMNRGDGNKVAEEVSEPAARVKDAPGVENGVYQLLQLYRIMLREGLNLKRIQKMADEMDILYYSSGSPGIVDPNGNKRCIKNFNTQSFKM